MDIFNKKIETLFNINDAIKIGSELSLGHGFPSNLLSMSKKLYVYKRFFNIKLKKTLNVIVVLVDNVKYLCRTFKHKERNTYYCFINEEQNIISQRYAIAHCYGHILLGHLEDGQAQEDHGFKINDIKKNMDANHVANHILLPSNQLSSLIQLNYCNLDKMAHLSLISTTLIAHRLREDGYID